mmetsp:Transcript_13628/g.26113  ORF Transcript_13628/g.26113 Transcript_13628/m.26113 type:complete len:155 (+) Transcript_13628:564-1028(+)
MAVQFFNSLCSFLSNAFYSLSSPFRCINQLPSPPFLGLTLHLSDGSTLKVQLEPLHVVEMKQATLKFFDLFKEKETWERPRRLDQIKVNLKSGGDHDRASLEMRLFMNPNAYPTAFQAKVLFNLKHSGGNGVEVSTEIPLSKFSESLDLYLSQN